MTFRPLLASEVDLKKLRYPVYASPKLDGIRAVLLDGKLLSRKLKPIPNDYVRTTIEAGVPGGMQLDGELVVGGSFNETSSAIMSVEGRPRFSYMLFDNFADPFGSFKRRLLTLSSCNLIQEMKVLLHTFIHDEDELLAYENRQLMRGYEGIMLRDPYGIYKFGRSTVNEGILLKLKRFKDEEATVVDFVERMHNENEPTKDELGYTKRSSHKANKRGTKTLGALVVESEAYTDLFQIGTGFNDEQRKEIWNHRKLYKGKLLKFKHQPYGHKDKPRFPVFLGWRANEDL